MKKAAYLDRSIEQGRMQALELTLTIAIIALVLWPLLLEAPVLQAKARLTEMMLGAAAQRMELVIDAATTGNYAVSSAQARTRVAAQASVEDAIGYRGRQPDTAVPGAQDGAPLDSKVPRASQEELNRLGRDFRYERREGRLIATGTVLGEPFQLPFALAVPAEGSVATVLWVCGDAAPPPGWVALRGPEATQMREELLFHPCRTPRGGLR